MKQTKLHAIVIRRLGKLPVAETLMLSRASMFDLTASKQIMINSSMRHGGYLLADKAYIDSEWAKTIEQEHRLKIIAPRKRAKGDTLPYGDVIPRRLALCANPLKHFFIG